MAGLEASARALSGVSGSQTNMGGKTVASEAPASNDASTQKQAAVLPEPFDPAWAAYKEQGGVSADKTQRPPFPADTGKVQLSAVPDNAGSKRLREKQSGADSLAEWEESYAKEADIRRRYDAQFGEWYLKDSYDDIVEAAKRHGVPKIIALSVIGHETGNGETVEGNNLSGVMIGKDQKVKKIFSTLQEGIDESVRIIAKNYKLAGGDLQKMRDIHAPLRDPTKPGGKVANDRKNLNKNWLPDVRWFKDFFEGKTTPGRHKDLLPKKPIPGVMIDENGAVRDRYTSPWQQSEDVDPWNRRYVFPKPRR